MSGDAVLFTQPKVWEGGEELGTTLVEGKYFCLPYERLVVGREGAVLDRRSPWELWTILKSGTRF